MGLGFRVQGYELTHLEIFLLQDVTVVTAIYAASPLDLSSLPPSAQLLYNGIEGFQNLAGEAALIFGHAYGN